MASIFFYTILVDDDLSNTVYRNSRHCSEVTSDRPPQTRAACQDYLTRIVNAILTDAGRGSQSLRNSRPPGIRELDGKTVLVKLRWIGCHQASEALTCRVNNVQVTVGTVIPPQADVCAGALIIGGVHLQ